MLSIRLSRVGKSRAPIYRVVVMPKHRDPWANTVEILGHYNPRTQPREFVVKVDRVKHWIEQGAEVSNTLWNLFIDEKIIDEKKRSVSHISDTRKAKLETKVVEAVKAADDAKAKKEAAAEKEKADAQAAKEAAQAAKAAEVEAAKTAAETPVETPVEAPVEPAA